MSVLMGVVGSFVAIIAFSVLLETPGKYLWQTGVVGAIGGGVYLLCTHRGVDVVPASFFSALAIAFMAHLFARIFKAPVTVFLIAGILPTVPGAGMYRIAYSIVANDRAGCAYYLLQTLEMDTANMHLPDPSHFLRSRIPRHILFHISPKHKSYLSAFPPASQ